MSDIRRLFDQLDAEPSVEFVGELKARLLQEARNSGSVIHAVPPNEGDVTMTVIDTPNDAPSSIPPRRRYGVLVGAVAAAAGLLVIIALAGGDNSQHPAGVTAPTAGAPTTVSQVHPPRLDLKPLTVPAQPTVPAPTSLKAGAVATVPDVYQVQFDGISLWAIPSGSKQITKIDPATGQVLSTVTLPAAPGNALAKGHDGYLYVPTSAGVVIVNGSTLDVYGPRAVAPDGPPDGIAFTKDTVWIMRNVPGAHRIERWDPGLNELRGSMTTGSTTVAAFTGAGDDLYVSNDQVGLQQFGSDGSLLHTLGGSGFAFGSSVTPAGDLWVADYESGELVHYRPGGQEAEHVALVAPSTEVARLQNVWATDSSVWAVLFTDEQLAVVDTATAKVTAKVDLPGNPTSVVVVDGVAWAAGSGWMQQYLAG